MKEKWAEINCQQNGLGTWFGIKCTDKHTKEELIDSSALDTYSIRDHEIMIANCVRKLRYMGYRICILDECLPSYMYDRVRMVHGDIL